MDVNRRTTAWGTVEETHLCVSRLTVMLDQRSDRAALVTATMIRTHYREFHLLCLCPVSVKTGRSDERIHTSALQTHKAQQLFFLLANAKVRRTVKTKSSANLYRKG
eukprot:GDKI01007150.1.p2 GENE.GDKI01007150.1~~GDKI01007150.1.p2  ORF type:complete len:107 (+),score=8.73 GDKI01007150.1:412-732(+)